MALWLLLAVLFLAYANGANDNFKGVATLFGSRTMNYKGALRWATLTTFAGSVTALLLSGGLVKSFSGAGLVPDALTQDPAFLLAVAGGTALTVMLATMTGLPISTTHALTGALVGAGFLAAGTVNLAKLGQKFFLPLAASPFLSLAVTGLLYPLLRRLRFVLGVERQMCLCVDGGLPQPVQLKPDGTAVMRSTGLVLTVGQLQECRERYAGRIVGIDAQWILDRLHVLSAGAVSFARGMNDTPKIVTLLIATQAFGLSLSMGLLIVGIGMAAGGLFNARRVAMTMSERITEMNHGQGFTANVVTALLVLNASRLGLQSRPHTSPAAASSGLEP